jgi:hypothetical protein
MKASILTKSILILLVLSFIGLPAVSGDLKTNALEQKIGAITLLRVKIMDKIDQAAEMRDHLEQRLAKLRGEIRAEQIRTEIYSHQTAQQNLRIHYNLRLIQTLQAYINLLNERIDYFQSGNERLKFLIDQINDDLAIITILKDMEVENLIDRINLVLDELTPETQKTIFNASSIRVTSLEYVWEKVCIKEAPIRSLP